VDRDGPLTPETPRRVSTANGRYPGHATTARAKLVVAALTGLLATGAVGSARGEPPRFVTVAPGIAHATFQVRPAASEAFAGHAFEVDLDAAELRLVSAGGGTSRRTVEEIVAPYPAVVAVNASFFDTEGRAMGLAVDEGRILASGRRRSWGALVIDDKHARIVLGAEIPDGQAHRLVVQGLPRFVVAGTVQPLKPQLAERTAVCAKGRVVVLVVTTKAESTPFARFLADPPEQGGLGCADALNLDGGPSTQLVVKLPGMTLSYPRGWAVPNALVVAPGKR
jgi:Phosphodiester glycosidase